MRDQRRTARRSGRLVVRGKVYGLLVFLTSAWSLVELSKRTPQFLAPTTARTVPGTALARVISYSLYGDDPRYTEGAFENALLVGKIYPGWSMRVYHDSSVPVEVLSRLEQLGVELRDMRNSSLNKMTWRFLVASDPNLTHWCVRDVDARLSQREKVCVDAWLASGKKAHVIRDHPSHTQVIPGGMWCGTSAVMPELERILTLNSVANSYNADQRFLKQFVWPRLRTSVLQHVSFGCKHFSGSMPIPVSRIGLEHVGSVFVGGNIRKIDTILLQQAIRDGKECIDEEHSP